MAGGGGGSAVGGGGLVAAEATADGPSGGTGGSSGSSVGAARGSSGGSSAGGASYRNRAEVDVVMRVLGGLVEGGEVASVAILTPYSAQVCAASYSRYRTSYMNPLCGHFTTCLL